MFLPRADIAIVEREKVVSYLLNPSHPDNSGKARYFSDLGFNCDHWDLLATALRELARHHSVLKTVASVHGMKYVVDGGIESPISTTALVRTIWIVDAGSEVPRLVTAYPCER